MGLAVLQAAEDCSEWHLRDTNQTTSILHYVRRVPTSGGFCMPGLFTPGHRLPFTKKRLRFLNNAMLEFKPTTPNPIVS